MKQIARFLVGTTFTALAIAAFFNHDIGETAQPSGCLVYVGTYTRQQSEGIYAFRFDPSTGKAATVGLAAVAENPSFLAVHPNRQFLYVEHTGSSVNPQVGSTPMSSTNCAPR